MPRVRYHRQILGVQRVAQLLVAQAAFLLCASLVPSAPLTAADYVNSQLPWHPAVLDSQGRLLAWDKPENNLGHDKVMRLAWDLVEH